MTATPVNPTENTPTFHPGLPAAQVDRELRAAVGRWQEAEHTVVLWYAELHRRRLFKELGFGNIHLYAAERLGFSQARSYQFLKLAERLRALPRLEEAVARGEVGWTKARAVARVATPENEGRWLEKAKNFSRRELEAKIDQTRRRAKLARAQDRDQLALGQATASGGGGNETEASDPDGNDRTGDDRTKAQCRSGRSQDLLPTRIEEDAADIPLSVSVQFDSTQMARYEALLAKLRQRGRREDRAELLLAAFESLLAEDDADMRSGDGITTSPGYQILVQKCPECERATVPTRGGDHPISRGELGAALCDAKIKREGGRNTSSLPPRIRRQALERDRHRCRMPGCGGRQFLHVHHIRAREDGGTHDLANLVTLCGACHRALHELGLQQQLAVLDSSVRVGETSARYETIFGDCRRAGSEGVSLRRPVSRTNSVEPTPSTVGGTNSA